MMVKTLRTLILVAWVVVFQACFISSAGTDVDNAVVAGMVMDGNEFLVGAKVSIMPVDYNPVRGDSSGRARTQRTSPDGTFRFVDLPPGSYALEALNTNESKMDWIDTLVVGAGDEVYAMATVDSSRLLFIGLPASAPQDAYLYVPGSNIYGMRESLTDTVLQLHHVPRVALPQIVMRSMSQTDYSRVLFTDVPTSSPDTLWAP